MADSDRDGPLPEFNEGTPVAVGTAIWVALLVVGLVLRDHLIAHDRGWWVWTAATGVALGGVGFLYLRRRRAALRATARSATGRTPRQS